MTRSCQGHGSILPGGRGGDGGEKELLEAWHADEEEEAHDEYCCGEGGHEEWLAVELFGVLDGAFRLERELEIDGHGEGDEGKAENELDAVADDEGAKEEHCRGGIEEDGDEQGFGGVALEGGAVGTGEGVVAGLVELGELGETLEAHEVAADHPVGDEEGDGWDEGEAHRSGDGVPAEEHAEWIVDGLGEDVEVGDVFGADGGKVVDAAHDPEDEGHEGEHFGDGEADSDAGDHHEEPLNVGYGDADQTSGGRTILLDGVEAVEGGVEDFVDDVVAAGNEGDGDEGEGEGLDQPQIEESRIDAEGDDDAGKNEEVLDGVVEPGDGDVGANPVEEGDSGALAVRHLGGLRGLGDRWLLVGRV